MPHLGLVCLEPVPCEPVEALRTCCESGLGVLVVSVEAPPDALGTHDGVPWLSAGCALQCVRVYCGAYRALGLVNRPLRTLRGEPVNGQAELRGRVAVVSAHRVGGDTKSSHGAAAIARFVGSAVHEVGHLAGLGHCGHAGCTMHRRPASVSLQSLLCPDCRSTWQHLLHVWTAQESARVANMGPALDR
jgi:hypothetical protein